MGITLPSKEVLWPHPSAARKLRPTRVPLYTHSVCTERAGKSSSQSGEATRPGHIWGKRRGEGLFLSPRPCPVAVLAESGRSILIPTTPCHCLPATLCPCAGTYLYEVNDLREMYLRRAVQWAAGVKGPDRRHIPLRPLVVTCLRTALPLLGYDVEEPDGLSWIWCMQC